MGVKVISEKVEALPTPPAVGGTAQQVRAMGLKVGDVIRGKSHPTSHTETELTVLWIGLWAAMFRVRRHNGDGIWSEPTESSSWDLTCREWSLVPQEEHWRKDDAESKSVD
jgi:hypothetical protein